MNETDCESDGRRNEHGAPSSDGYREKIERELDRYHTWKIMSGKGLEDDPEWVEKFRHILDDE